MDAKNDAAKPRMNDPMRLQAKFRVRAHQGGTYSGLQVTFLQRECGHSITAPASTLVTRIARPHFGQGMSNSVALVKTRSGPSTIDGGCDIRKFFQANVKGHAPAPESADTIQDKGCKNEKAPTRGGVRVAVRRLVSLLCFWALGSPQRFQAGLCVPNVSVGECDSCSAKRPHLLQSTLNRMGYRT